MAKFDFQKISKDIIENVGGLENILNISHCATRLRLHLKDLSKADKGAIKKLDSVLGCEEAPGDELQVIVGQYIEDLFFAFEKESGLKGGVVNEVLDKDLVPGQKKNIGQLFLGYLQMMAGIMAPVIPTLIIAGFMSLLLTLGTKFFGLDTTSSTYTILNNISQAPFYFLPMFVAYTSARKFEVEPPLAMLLCGILLYPGWVELVNTLSATGTNFASYFGIPVYLCTYNSSTLPIVLSVFIMSKIDKWLVRVIPNSVRYFLKPVLLIFIMSIITLSITGPLGYLITDYVAAGINFVRTHAPWLTVPAIYLFSATFGMFAPGFHLALIPIATTNFATLGYDDIINIWFFSGTTVPGFTALWFSLKTKSVKGKNVGIPAAISALFGGISEPTTYGITYRVPQLWLVNAIAGFTLAVYNGIVGTKAYAYGAYYLTNLPLFYSESDPANLWKAIIGVLIVAVITFIGVFFIDWEYPEDDDQIVVGPPTLSLFKKKNS